MARRFHVAQRRNGRHILGINLPLREVIAYFDGTPWVRVRDDRPCSHVYQTVELRIVCYGAILCNVLQVRMSSKSHVYAMLHHLLAYILIVRDDIVALQRSLGIVVLYDVMVLHQHNLLSLGAGLVSLIQQPGQRSLTDAA